MGEEFSYNHVTHLQTHLQRGVLTWILPLTPVLSIRLAMFTVRPQMSYWGLVAPITPAITGPWAIPADDVMRSWLGNHLKMCFKWWKQNVEWWFAAWVKEWRVTSCEVTTHRLGAPSCFLCESWCGWVFPAWPERTEPARWGDASRPHSPEGGRQKWSIMGEGREETGWCFLVMWGCFVYCEFIDRSLHIQPFQIKSLMIRRWTTASVLLEDFHEWINNQLQSSSCDLRCCVAHLSVRWEARSCHVRAADGFYLLHLLEETFIQQLHRHTGMIQLLTVNTETYWALKTHQIYKTINYMFWGVLNIFHPYDFLFLFFVRSVYWMFADVTAWHIKYKVVWCL